MQSRELYERLVESVTSGVPPEEKQAIIRWLLEARSGIKATDLLAGRELPLAPHHFEHEIKRLNEGEPLQYILGEAYFYGRKFRVNPAVLIPRPETELLVDYVIRFVGKNFVGQLLDIGTGSGCIAVTLALELPGAKIFATDVDPLALAVAKDNARGLGARVDFLLHDVLTEELQFPPVDVVLSNPPYIRESERASMDTNVTGYEPHGALFVPDADPMVFHRTLAQKAKLILKPGGLLALEINEALGDQTASTIREAGYAEVVVHRDLDGKDRYVTALHSA